MNDEVNLFAQLSDERKRVFAEKVYDMIMKEREAERLRSRDDAVQGTRPECGSAGGNSGKQV